MIATFTSGQDNTFEVALSLNLEAAIAGIGPEHDDTNDSAAAPVYDRLRELPPGALRQEFHNFAPAFLDAIQIDFGDGDANLAIQKVTTPPVGDLALPRISSVVLAGRMPPEVRGFSWGLDRSLGASVIRIRQEGTDQILHATHVPGGETVGPLEIGAPEPQLQSEVFANYVWVGFSHILPKGLDHILFVVGLFLLSVRTSMLVWQISAFTVAHTVTIALGTLGVVNVPAWVVEPLIALSIAWIGIENILTVKLHRWRLAVVFVFGLLHGLGFASVLKEIGLSATHFVTGLLAFNIGVELGQLTVIALCFLAVGWLMHWQRYRQAVVVPGSLVITVVAIAWFVERTGMI